MWIRIVLTDLDNHDPTPGYGHGAALNKMGICLVIKKRDIDI